MTSILKVDQLQDSGGNAIITSDGAGNFTYTAGATGMGKVLQVVQATYTTQVVNTTNVYADTGLTASITPASASNKILVLVNQPYLILDTGTSTGGAIRLLRDSTVILGGVTGYELYFQYTASDAGMYGRQTLNILDSPSTTSSTTYKTQSRRYNTGDDIRTSPDGMDATIILMEIAG